MASSPNNFAPWLLILCTFAVGLAMRFDVPDARAEVSGPVHKTRAVLREPERTGLIRHLPEAAPGYTLFAPLKSETT